MVHPEGAGRFVIGVPRPAVLRYLTGGLAVPNLPKLIQALPSLTQAELQALKLAIDTLLDAPDNTGAEELFQITVNILGIKSIGYKQFSKTKAYGSWVRNSACIDILIDTILGDIPRSKIEVSHLKKFLMQLVMDDLKAGGYQVTMHSIANAMFWVEETFDNNYPGYLASGVASFVLKGMMTK